MLIGVTAGYTAAYASITHNLAEALKGSIFVPNVEANAIFLLIGLVLILGGFWIATFYVVEGKLPEVL